MLNIGMTGGTAINMFVLGLPRLSVDTDVVTCSHELGRDEALAIIHDELVRAR